MEEPVPLDSIDVHVIVNAVVHLDIEADRVRLPEMVTRVRPRWSSSANLSGCVDEKADAGVAPLLAYRREL